MTLRSGEVYFSEQSDGFLIPESVSFFGFSVSFYGICLVLAALVGIIVISEVTRRRQQSVERSLTLIAIAIVSALLGGRLYYVVFEWKEFAQNPAALFNFRSGGLSYFGALFGAWFAVKWYCHRKDADFLQCADILCFGAAAVAPFVWCGCAFVREPLGKLYDGVFSVRISGRYFSADNGEAYVSMHPVALYGIVLSVISGIVLCVVLRKAKQNGTVFTSYLVSNAVVMCILEWFRWDSYCIWGTAIPVNFVVSGVILLTITISGMRQFSINKKLKNIHFISN